MSDRRTATGTGTGSARPGAVEHPYHRALGTVLGTAGGLVVVEGAAVELLLALLWPGTIWPWVSLALHLAALAGLARLGTSFARRPHLLDATTLTARDGRAAEIVVERAAILSARASEQGAVTGRSGLVVEGDRARMTHLGPQVVLRLDPARPVCIRGRDEPVPLRSLALTADDPARLVRALRAPDAGGRPNTDRT